MKQFFKKNKFELLLVLIAFLWGVIVFYLLQIDVQTYKFPDTFSYLFSVEQLYNENVLNDHRPFLFSLINGIPLVIGLPLKAVLLWSVILNILSWFGTIILLYNILFNVAGRKNAFILTLLYLFSFGSFLIVFHFLTEPIFTFLLILIFYYFQRFEKTKAKKHLAYAFSLLILSLLIKPILKFFILIVFVFYFKDFIRMLKSKFSFFLVIPIILVFFQMYSLNKDYGNFTISYIDTATYYNFLGTKADCFKNNTEFEQGKNKRHYYYAKLSPTVGKSVAIEDLKNQLKNNKLNLLKAYLSNLYINSTKGSASVFACENIKKKQYFQKILFLFKASSKITNIIFTFLGISISILIITTWKKNEGFIKLVALAILYMFFISGISSDQGDRLHIIFVPLIIILICKKRALFKRPIRI